MFARFSFAIFSFSLVLFLTTSIFGISIPVAHAEFVSPGQPTNYVTDFANIVSDQTEAALNAELENFDKETSTQIFVATVSSLGGDDIASYGVELARSWKIGTTQNNGVLILVAPNERQVRIEVGYGLEGVLTDYQSSQVIQRDILPQFRDKNYDQGITDGVHRVMGITRGEVFEVEGESVGLFKKILRGLFSNIELFFFFLFIFGQFIISTLASSKSWWLGGVLGAGLGALIGVAYGFIFAGIIAIILLTASGLGLDYLVSKKGWGKRRGNSDGNWIYWGGGSGGSDFSSGGGFSGGGGGSFGGGGSSGSW